MAIRPLALAALALASLALAAPAASAGVRAAAIVDARDGWPTATGQPSTPDLARVDVAYDDLAGTLAVTADFFADTTTLSSERAYAWSLRFTLGRPSSVQPGACTPLVQGHVQIAAANGSSIANRLAIMGTDGYLPLEPTFVHPPALPGSRLSFTAASLPLANLDLRCLAFSIAAREYGPADDAQAIYDEPCDCWYVGVVDDTVPLAWFAGFKPADPSTTTPHSPSPGGTTPAGPRRRSTIRVLFDRGMCSLTVALASITPGESAALDTTRPGFLVVRASGRVTRTVRKRLPSLTRGTRLIAVALLRNLPEGQYTFRVHYTGDAHRRASPGVTARMKIHCA